MHILVPAGVVALAVAAIALAVRYVSITNRVLLGVAALATYLMLGAPVSLIVFALQRDWILAAAAAAATIATVAAQLPWYVRSAAVPGVGVRLMSANLRYGRADADAVVRLARKHADILSVQKLTPEKADQISAAGIGEILPYRVPRAREGPAGVGIWSRCPMTRGADYDEFWLGLITAQVRITGVPAEATVVTTHMSAPWPEPIRGWRDDLTRLATVLNEIGAAASGPVIVAGDLNATPDVLEFRRLLQNGYHDAAEQAGAGLTRTHPADIVNPALVRGRPHSAARRHSDVRTNSRYARLRPPRPDRRHQVD